MQEALYLDCSPTANTTGISTVFVLSEEDTADIVQAFGDRNGGYAAVEVRGKEGISR